MAIFNFTNPGQYGSAYFTLETVPNNQGFFDSSSFPNAQGYYSNFTNLNESYIVTSSYVFGVVVPPGSSSFEFNPSNSAMPTGSLYFRGTGGIGITVDTYSGSYVVSPSQGYNGSVLNTFPLTPVPNFQARVAANSGSYEALSCQNAILADIGTEILSSASLLVTPNGYTEGVLFGTLPNSSSGDLTVTRATTATRVNSDGLVELVPYNLLSYTEDFAASYWGKDEGVTATSNTTIAPDGSNTADTITLPLDGVSSIYKQFAVTALTTYTVSFYIRATSGQAGNTVCFQTQPELITNMITLTNDWVRHSVVVTPTSGTWSIEWGRKNSATATSFFLWGAQLVEGSTAKDYLPTTTRLNIPRLDYSNGSCPSLLVEPQRTNLLDWSEDFTNVVWTKTTGVSVTSDSSISPSGVQNADTIVGATGPYVFGGNNTFARGVGSLSSSTPYTFSVYLKGSGSVTITCRDGGTGFTNNVVCALTSSWQRFEISRTTAAASTALAYVFSDASGNFDIWGAQLEAGAYATSYIPTTETSITRNADVISKTGISSLIGQTEGVIFIDYYASAQNIDTLSYAYLFIGGTFPDNYQIYNYGTTLYWYIRNASGIIISQTANQTLVAGSRYKIALAYKSGEYALYINGVQKRTSTNSSAPPAMSQFNLNAEDFGASAAKVKNEFNAVAFWPTRLTNDQLTALTTI
jgi:hypothetical protein